MFYIVSFTTRGRISIPIKIRRKLGFDKTRKVLVYEQNGKIVVEPTKDTTESQEKLKAKRLYKKTI